MTTADWALVISLCSFAVALAGFVWNVWSKFMALIALVVGIVSRKHPCIAAIAGNCATAA